MTLDQVAMQHGLRSFCILEHGAVVYASADFSAFFGVTVGPSASAWAAMIAPGDLARVQYALKGAHHTGEKFRVAFGARRADGTCSPLVATIARIDAYREQPLLFAVGGGDAHDRILAELRLLAFKDPLTGLANRACFLEECRAMLQRCRNLAEMAGVLLADLDGFGELNDMCGRAAGDEMLIHVARCMKDAVREGDVVARLGDDEFAIALPRLASVYDAALVAGRLIERVADSARARPYALPIGISAGIAIWPADGDSIDALFDSADHAMRHAKLAGRNRYCLAANASDAHDVKALHFFDWGRERELGIPGMDGDHRAMAALINELGDELKSGRDEERLVACMDRLVSHTAAHFAREEYWMDMHDYIHAAAHKAEHTRLLEDLAGLSVRLDSRSMVLTMRYLQEWLCWHTHESDRLLAQAMLAPGSMAVASIQPAPYSP